MNSHQNILRLILIALLSGFIMHCGVIAPINTPTPTETITPTLTSTLTDTIASTLTDTSAPSIIGKWERHGKQNDRPYTEHFSLNPDGTYSIEAKFDDIGEILASTYGTYLFTETTLMLTDKDNKTTNSTYYLDATGNKLIIDNKPEFAWTRLQ
jgi:predicted glycosyl hydrolase (DUF1957 family)